VNKKSVIDSTLFNTVVSRHRRIMKLDGEVKYR